MITQPLRKLLIVVMLVTTTACSNLLTQNDPQDEQQTITDTDTTPNAQQVTNWSSKAVELFNLGNQNLDKDADIAANYFNRAIAEEPKMEAAYFNLMKLYFVSVDDVQESDALENKTSVNSEKMQQVFHKAEKENLLTARILTLVGTEKRIQGQFKEAEKFYQSALKKDASYLVALANMAILQDLYLHNLVSALNYYNQYQLQLITQGKGDNRVTNWLADIKRRIAKAQKEKS